MDKLTVIEYLELESSRKKKKYLASVIGSKELRMIGKVHQIFGNYCKVINIRTISSEEEYSLFIPFKDDEGVFEILGSGATSKELEKKKIEKGAVIFFSIKPNEKKYEEEGKYFTIQRDSVAKAEECEEFYKSIELEKTYSKLFQDFSIDNEKNKIYFAKDLEKAHEDMLNKIKDKKQERDDIEEVIQNLNNDLASLDKRYKADLKSMNDKLNEDYKEKNLKLQHEYDNEERCRLKEIEEIESRLSDLKKYNILSLQEQVSITKDEDKIYIEDLEERIKHIQGYLMLNNKKPLYYDVATIKNLYTGLKTEQIIVLAGKPGSGKTSLVEGFAGSIDAELFLIPVQPNWMDKSDLLGFYNPIEKSYVSTPFLDALLSASKEAEKNREKIFFICLDEMNLSHVEYYFAEFLSKLQTDRKIQLYSKAIFEDIKEELKDRKYKFKSDIKDLTIESFLTEHSEENIENYLKLKKQCKMIDKYPHEFVIPHNVKFLGTINKDETTKTLSPKVTDRCFIIKLESQIDTKEKKKLIEMFAENKEHYAKKLDLRYNDIEIKPNIIEEKLEKEIVNIKKKLLQFNISISNRFDRTMNQLLAGESFNNINEALDIAISSLILPKINVSSDDIHLEELINVLEQISSGKPISSSVLQWMLSYNDDKLTYWR